MHLLPVTALLGQDKLYPQSVGWLWKSLLLTTITPQLLWLISNLFGGSHQINPLNQIIPFASARIAFVYLGEPTPVSGCSGKPPSQTLFRLSPCRRKLAGCHSTPVSGCLGDFSLICCNHSRLVTDFMPSEQMIPMTQTMRRHTCLATERKDPSTKHLLLGILNFSMPMMMPAVSCRSGSTTSRAMGNRRSHRFL